jgi:VWFA-related protein
VLREILIFGLAVALRTLPAQAPAVAAFEQPFKLTATADLVLLDVSVKDALGAHVSNLSKDNFQVHENGKLQAITQFGRDDVPVTVGLVIDTSGSMRLKYGDVVTAALALIHASNPRDEVFVVNFGDRVSYGLPDGTPFTDNPGQLRAALAMGAPAGRTALYDAILSSLHHLEQGTRDKKTLVLISDGGDNSSSQGSEEVVRAVRESRATIYTIGIFDAGDQDQNPGLLRRLAHMSGGEAFFPERLEEVTTICRQIASDIRTRYTVGYAPVRSGQQGSLRKIRVSASTPAGSRLVVHTRTSYSLPDTDQSGEASRKRSR